VITTAILKLTTAKAALVVTAAATAAAGGVAVAATTGVLPSPTSETSVTVAAQASEKPAAGGKAGKETGRDADKAAGGKAGKQGEEREGGPAGAQGSPSPSLVGLCHAVSSGNKAEHGKALQNPAFRHLVTTAGGADKVDAFCAALLASDKHDGKPDTGKPADPGAGNGKPDSGNTDKPGRPENPGNGKSDKGDEPVKPRTGV
jgi:hypothetical protein